MVERIEKNNTNEKEGEGVWGWTLISVVAVFILVVGAFNICWIIRDGHVNISQYVRSHYEKGRIILYNKECKNPVIVKPIHGDQSMEIKKVERLSRQGFKGQAYMNPEWAKGVGHWTNPDTGESYPSQWEMRQNEKSTGESRND